MSTMTDTSPESGKQFIIGAALAAFVFAMTTGCANRGSVEATAEPIAEVAAEPAPPPPPPVRAAKPAPAPTTTARATTPAKPTATTPAPAAPATTAQGAGGPGMDARGNVIDSSKVTAGSGRKVKGLNDWEGEITGNPAPNSRFSKLQIGMSMRQVVDLIGQPTDQGAYITGRSFIPFYFGSDRHRFEMAYKGQGRLIFAGGSIGDFSGGNLIWVIHNANDSGQR
jgi:hypothetical protein